MVVVPRIRLKTRGGISVVGEVMLNKDIVYHTREIIKKLRFNGYLNIQFKKEDSRGFSKLQEIDEGSWISRNNCCFRC